MTHDDTFPDGAPAPLDAALIDRCLAGEATPAERALAESDPMAHRILMQDVAEFGLGRDGAAKAERIDRAWQRVAASLRAESVPSRVTQSVRPPVAGPFKQRSWLAPAVAAGAIGVLAIQAAVFWGRSHRNAPASPDTTQTYSTVRGQQAVVTLADGTRATLGPATSLTVSRDVRRGTTVRVQGEVLFTVVHQSSIPFTVKAGASIARVLGTTFGVRYYAADREARIIVTDGRVAVQGASTPPHVLGARMLAVVNDSGAVRVTPNVTIDDYTGWTNGRLVFRNLPARDVLTEISRAYGVDIRIADSALAQQRLTWEVSTRQRSLDDVADVVAELLRAHVRRSGDGLMIVPGRRALRAPVVPSTHFTPEPQYGR